MYEEKRMGFVDHLEEVRSRLIVSLIAILITTSLAYVFSDAILHLLITPSEGIIKQLVAFGPMDGFMIRFRVALYGGLVLAAPVWIFEILRFVEPALMPNEKKWIIPGVLATIALFLAGNAFGYMMLEKMMPVLSGMYGSELTYMPSADQYIQFVVYFLVATGISFELPIIMLILMRLGIVSPQALKKQRRIAYFIIFVFAELITPVSDPIVAPMVVMIPMVILFEGALFFARFIIPKPKPASLTPGSSVTK